MKKHNTLAAVLMLFALVFTGCEKKNEWSKYSGYSNEDIIGNYSYSNVTDAFYGLSEGEFCHICPDAEISITGLTDNTVKFVIKCPEAEFSREYIGTPRKFKNDFMVQMTSGYLSRGSNKLKSYTLTSYVYKNEVGKIRLHGFASYNKFNVEHPVPSDLTIVDTVLIQSVNYYFDMIKD